MNTIDAAVDVEGVSLDFEQVNPRKEDGNREEEGANRPADLGTPELSLESDAEPQDSTSDGVVDPLRLLGLSVIGRAVEDGNRDWFFSSRSRDIFCFWCQVAQVQPSWVQRKVAERELKPLHCPGLRKVGKVWWLDIYQGHKRQRIRIGAIDSEAALQNWPWGTARK